MPTNKEVKTHPITNPDSGLDTFGVVPKIRLGGVAFAETQIQLFQGKHSGPNKGFGVRHIWAEHQREMKRVGFLEESDVARYVLSILQPGTSLFYEGASWKNTRLMAVRSAKGTVILEYRERREGPVWAVVTAFSGTKTHGTRVGAVR
jgi:hypothetical protein